MIFIGTENEKLIKGIYKKLKSLGYTPHLYKRKEKSEESKIGNLVVRYSKDLWTINKKTDIANLTSSAGSLHPHAWK